MSKNKSYPYVIVFCYSLALIAFKPYGVDWLAYSNISIDFERFYFFREPLGWLIPLFFRNFENGNLYSSIVIGSILITGTIKLLRTINNNSTINIVFAILLAFSNFYLLLSVNGLRQGLALGFLLFAIASSRNKNYRTSLFLMIMATLSHNSAILFFPILFYEKINISINLKLVSSLPLLMLAPLINRLAGKNSLLSVTDNSNLYLVVSSLLFILSILQSIYDKEKTKKKNFVISFFLYVTVLGFYPINSAFERLIYFVIPLQLIFISPLFNLFKPKLFALFILIIILVLSIVYNLSHPSVQNNFINL